ncbi:MAG: glycoside hydrolase family protein [Rhodobacteraceae bacterium]|nr:glycoside hydrolase family protein [Paracoccaceae bacterium]
MQVSQRLTDFVAAEEGVVTRAYRDPVGILTIGVGHTTAAGGLVVKAGMTLTRQQVFELLRKDLAKFAKRCETAMPHSAPHELEGATSFDFNTGAIHKASWVKFWEAEDVGQARRRFLLWNKAGGKRLRGLVARREREADIIFLNKWPVAQSAVRPESHEENTTIGHLQSLGYLRSAVVSGGSSPLSAGMVTNAIEVFQQQNDLVVDGIAGPATRATLQRVLAAKNANKASVASGAITGGGALPIEGINSMTALAVVAGVIVAGIVLGWAYRNRGRLFGIRAKITNGEA